MKVTKAYAREILDINRPVCTLNNISGGALHTKLSMGKDNRFPDTLTEEDISVIYAALVMAGVTKEF